MASVGALSAKRKLCEISASLDEPQANTIGLNECDTNADTCCLGQNFIILQFSTPMRTAYVYAYIQSYQPVENVPIVTGATAYDDPVTGQTYILIFHESLYYGTKLDHSLINPNELRNYGLKVMIILLTKTGTSRFIQKTTLS